jgi:hypothetical protein
MVRDGKSKPFSISNRLCAFEMEKEVQKHFTFPSGWVGETVQKKNLWYKNILLFPPG